MNNESAGFKMRLTEEQRKEIREDILFFLFRNNYWQSRHCPHVNISNKLSQHSRKHINKELKIYLKMNLSDITQQPMEKMMFI